MTRLKGRDKAIFFSILAGAGLLFVIGLALRGADEPSLAPTDAPPVATPATPAQPADKAQERADALPADLQPGQALALQPPYAIVDGLTFAAGPITIRLAGLNGPPAKAACKDEAGNVWACGLQARAALNNETRQRLVSCVVSDLMPGGMARASCSVDSVSLSERLIAAGWAQPEGASTPAEAAALNEARDAHRGLWNGGWSLVEIGPAAKTNVEMRRAFDTSAPAGN